MARHRRFHLHRDVDHSGVSGVGVVAEGIEFSDGVVALRWIVPEGNPGAGSPTSVVFHDNGIDSVEKVHGHSGSTRIVWDDERLIRDHPFDPDSPNVLAHYCKQCGIRRSSHAG